MTTYIRQFICVDPNVELPFLSDSSKKAIEARNRSLRRTAIHHIDNGWSEQPELNPNIITVKMEL